MIEDAEGTRTPVIDASVHIFFPSNKDLRGFLREPFKRPRLSRLRDGLVRGTRPASTRRTPRDRTANTRGSSVELVADELFSKRGVDVAILHPMGPPASCPTGTSAARCTPPNNENDGVALARTRRIRVRSSAATIRVNPDDIAGAQSAKSKNGRSHPRVVQIGVPPAIPRRSMASRNSGRCGRPRPDAEPAGGGSHRIRRRHRISAHAVRGTTRTYEQYVGLHWR
ncbi:amidohydrolase family domain protein [Mycobacterium kansasii 662]|uniref:Amidohydrolase family domain protein n=1 Tax=Mycobacterium kansasii 662 TaxID=1299326 RepID=X7XQT7_MYCKA|nr:amidohydrolase family domain protein [Mycobacterium kansasii 662]